MLNIRILKKFGKYPGLKYKNLRFLNTIQKNVRLEDFGSRKKYVKPVSTKELKPLNIDFLKDLFVSTIDKRLFEYPLALQSQDLHLVLEHSSELEDFLNKNLKSEITDDILENLKSLELFGLSVPQQYGGAGYNETETKFLQECSAVNPTIARFLNYNENFGCKLLNEYGNEEQKLKYLPGLAEGKNLMTLAYLETGPLVDFSQFEGYVIVDDVEGQYIINAEKKWVHNADKSDLFLVMLKIASFVDTDTKVQFNMFIVDKKTPGVTVHKLNSMNLQNENMFEVSFKNVCIPKSNLLGNVETNGFAALKFGLTHSQLTDAALCLCVVKKLIHSATQFCKEKTLFDTKARGYHSIQENLAELTVYAYALESSIYLSTGRFDIYSKPDLFNDSVLTKTLGVDILRLAIKKYMEILGRECFRNTEILETAINTLQYYSVFEENIENLKMMIASEGLLFAMPKLKKKVLISRKPYEYCTEAIKQVFFSSREKKLEEYKSQHKFKMELHSSLASAADNLEVACGIIQNAAEELFTTQGSVALDNEHAIAKFTEMAAYIYASVACLSRASSSICYDFKNCFDEALIAKSFVYISTFKVNELYKSQVKYGMMNENFKKIGKMVFNYKEYPAEHPLSRTV